MDINLILEYPFTKGECKQQEIKDSDDLNGFYIYNFNKIYINLGSFEFKNKSEIQIKNLFTKVAAHETLHKEIYKVTDTYNPTEVEENLILSMCGQK